MARVRFPRLLSVSLLLALLAARGAHADAACDQADGPFSDPAIVAVDLSQGSRPDNELTGMPLQLDTQYQLTVSGVTFLFESLSGQPLATPNGLLSFGFGGGNGIAVTINPPVEAVGFFGVESDGCPGGTFSGTAGSEMVFCGVPCPAPFFTGAFGLGDIGSVDASRLGAVFDVTELRFLPPGPIPTGSADLGVTKTVDCAPGATECSPATQGIRALNAEPFEFRIDVENAGPDAADTVLVTDFLPGGIAFGSPTPGVAFPSPEVATFQQSTLAANGSLDVILEGETPPLRRDFSCGYSLLNVASVTSATPDPRLGEDPADDPVVNRNLDVDVVRFDDAAVAGFVEVCGNGLDDDCDGKADCGDPDQCNCRPTLPPLPGGDPNCFGGFQEALVDLGLAIPTLCTAEGNPAPAHACQVPRGQCGGVAVPAFCCDPATFSDPQSNLSLQQCDVGVPGCAPRDPNFKSAVPGVNLHGFGYTAAAQTIRYTLHYENVGNADAHDVRVLDVLDLDLDDATIDVEDGGSYDPVQRLVQWLDPVVPPGVPRSVSFSIAVRDDAPPGTRVRNVGTIVFPDAVPPTRIDTNFVEHVVPDPSLVLAPALSVRGCTETAPGSGQYAVEMVNDGPGFAYHVSAAIVGPPASVSVSQGTAAAFSHPDDLPSVPTVIAFATTTSADTVAFTTQTPSEPCDALLWRISWEDAAGNVSVEDVRARPDGDADAVPDADDNCPSDYNPTQQDADADGDGDACDTPSVALCDVDEDGDVDAQDVDAIFAARGQAASGPDDPRDANGDGILSVNDARICALACTLDECASPAPPPAPAPAPRCGLLGVEPLLLLLLVARARRALRLRAAGRGRTR